MDQNAEPELIMWEYKWGSEDFNQMNKLGKEGWEAVGVSSITTAAPLGMTIDKRVNVLYKRRIYPKPPRENEAGFRLKQLLEEERNRNKD